MVGYSAHRLVFQVADGYQLKLNDPCERDSKRKIRVTT